MGKRACLKLLCLMLLILPVLSGCGKEEDDQLGIDGYVYTTYQIDIKGSSADEFKVVDGYVYYRLRDYETRIDDLRRFPVDEILSMEGDSSVEGGASTEQPRLPSAKSLFSAAGGSRGYISDYAVDEDGCFYYLMEKLNARDVPVLRPLEGTEGYVMDYGDISYVLVKRQADGTEAYSVSLPGTPGALALGGEGWIYILMEDCIFVLDDEGRALDQLSVAEDEAAALIEGEAGTVYYYEVNARDAVQRIVTAGKPGSTRLERLAGPCHSGYFSGSRQGLFYTGDDGTLYRYRGESDSWEAVLRWGDSNLVCNSRFTMLPLSEGRMAVILSAYGKSYITEDMFCVLTKTPIEELPKKEVLVMAVGGSLFDRLEQYVMDFNRNSEDYHVTIRRYDDLTRLDAELVSSNPPDMINLTYMDYTKYGQKDALEDLMPYLEASSVLDRAYYRQSVLDACTVKGRLVCIPDEIYCNTVMGRASQVGSEPGWSAEEAMALAESHPQARLFKGSSFSAMIRYFFQDYILEQYVDWESGECSFDGEEFVAFIKWAAEHSDGADSEEIPMEVLLDAMPEERLLDITASVINADTFLNYRTYFGEEVTAVGYPTARGEVSHHGTPINQLGIVSASDKKEGAWQFIESFLSRENGIYTFLPARQDRMEEDAAKLAEEGLYFNLPDGTEKKYSIITEEDLEKIYAIIDRADFTPREGIREDIVNIIVEEMSPCLSGAKSYEEAAAIVQNRVMNMVQEEIR